MATSPHTHPELYKSIILGGETSPGVVTLQNPDRGHKWREQNPKGSAGAFTVNDGPNPTSFSASLYLADDDDLEAWDVFHRAIASSVGTTTPRSLPIYHPDLARNGITDVVITSISGMKRDDDGGATVVIKFLEYRPPKKRPSKKAAGGTDAKKRPEKPDPNAQAKRELAALLEVARQP